MPDHKICEWCEGTGRIVHYPARGNPFMSKPYEIECSECDGDGYVEADSWAEEEDVL